MYGARTVGIPVIYNNAGAAFVGIGVVVGLVAGSFLPLPAALIVGALATAISDFAYRRRSGDFDGRGGTLYHVPVWLLAVGLAGAVGAIWGIEHARKPSATVEAASAPYVSSTPSPEPARPPVTVTQLDAKTSADFEAFTTELLRRASDAQTQCDKQRSAIEAHVEAHLSLIEKVYGEGATEPRPEHATRIQDNLRGAIELAKACELDLVILIMRPRTR